MRVRQLLTPVLGCLIVLSASVWGAETERTVTGPVLGVNSSARELTLRDPETRKPIKILIPVEATITMDGKPARLRDFERGNRATIRFIRRETGERIAVVARVPDPMDIVALPPPEESPMAATALPSTASLRFMPLFVGLGLLALAGILTLIRRSTVVQANR